MCPQVRIIKSTLARNLTAKPCRALEGLIDRRQLHLRDGKTLIVTRELINLEGMSLVLHKPAALIYKRALGKLQKLEGLACIYLLLPLIARESPIARRALYREPRAIIAHPHTHCSTPRGDIALNKA